MPIYKIENNLNSYNEIGPIGFITLSFAAITGLSVLGCTLPGYMNRKKKIKILKRKGLSFKDAMDYCELYKNIDKINHVEADKRVMDLVDKFFKKEFEYAKYNNTISKQIIEGYKKEISAEELKKSIVPKINQLEKKIDYSDIKQEFNKIKNDLNPEDQDCSIIKKWYNILQGQNFSGWDVIMDEVFHHYSCLHDEDDEEYYAENTDEMNDGGLFMSYERSFGKSMGELERKIYDPYIISKIIGSVKVQIKK